MANLSLLRGTLGAAPGGLNRPFRRCCRLRQLGLPMRCAAATSLMRVLICSPSPADTPRALADLWVGKRAGDNLARDNRSAAAAIAQPCLLPPR